MHTLSDNDLFHRLAFDNPWWEFNADTRIQFRNPPKRSLFASFARHITTPAPETPAITVLAGPLRAGKTVLLRQSVAHLIEQGVPSTAIFYCNMTVPSYTAADIHVLFEMFCRRYHHGPKAEIYVIYDEIQYIKDWQKSLQQLARIRPNTRFIVALSSGAPDINFDINPPDKTFQTFVLPPLSFREFMRFRGTEEKLFSIPDRNSNQGVILKPQALAALNAEWHRYINFGGFIEGIALSKEGQPAPTFIRDGVADRVLHKDLASLHGINDAQELNRLFSLLAFNTGREVSMDELAKAVKIAKNTLRKYLDYLEQAFLIRRLPRVDRNGKRFQRAVYFKVYLTAPCLYSALFAPVAMDDAYFHRLSETALICQWLGSKDMAQLAYSSWKTGAIDFLMMDKDSDRPSHVYDLDWNNVYKETDKKPDHLVKFIQDTAPDARPYILTRSQARPASMNGVDLTLAPMALYAYWIDRGLGSSPQL